MQRTPPAPTATSRWLPRRPALRRAWLPAACLLAGLALMATSVLRPPQPTAKPGTGRVAPRPAPAAAAVPSRVPARPAVTRVIAAAGDIACDPASPDFRGGRGGADACHMRAVARMLVHLDPAEVLTLGDNQYENGALAKFRRSYDPAWGRVKARTRPAPGNHDYETDGAAGYFRYFGKAAGSPTRGFYSFDVGAWHLIALNSECVHVGGCEQGSLQERWLRADLAAHPATCTLAYWHKPRFSSGWHGNNATYDAFWRALYEAGADLVLVGHDHDYERFAPQDPAGFADQARGLRQIVVGTGGKTHYGFRKLRRNSEVRNTGTFGVLKLTLRPTTYDWRFLPEPGKTFGDSGHGRCH